MADREVYELKLSVKVDKETAQSDLAKITSSLQQMGYQVKQLEDITKLQNNTSKEQKNIFTGLASELKGMALRWFAWGEVIRETISFIKESIISTREHDIAIKQLETSLKAIGLNYQEEKKHIEEVLEAATKGTKFTKDEMLKVYSDLLLKTKDVNQAFKILIGSMDVSTGTGKSLQEVITLSTNALVNENRGITMLSREFGKLGSQGKDINEVLTNLYKQFENQRYKVDDLSKGTTELNEKFREIKEKSGKYIIEALTPVVNLLSNLIEFIGNTISKFKDFIKFFSTGVEVILTGAGKVLGIIEKAITGISYLLTTAKTLITIIIDGIASIGAAFYSLITGNILGAKNVLKGFKDDISKFIDDWAKEIKEIGKNTSKSITDNGKLAENEFEKIMKSILERIKGVYGEADRLDEEYAKFKEEISKEIINAGVKTKDEMIKLVEIEYEAKKRQLEKFKKEGKDTSEAEVLLEQWKNAQIDKINREAEENRLEFKQEIRRLDTENLINELQKQIQAINDAYEEDKENHQKMVAEGKMLQSEYDEWLKKRQEKRDKDLEKAGKWFVDKFGEQAQMMMKISEEAYSAMEGSFKNFITEAIKGGQHLENAMKGFFDSILNAFVDMLSKMIAEYIAKSIIFSIFPGARELAIFKGGFLGAFQTGGIIPETGAYIMHKGERVIPAGSSETITNNNPVVVNLNFHTFDVRQIDRIHMERLARTMADYLKGKV